MAPTEKWVRSTIIAVTAASCPVPEEWYGLPTNGMTETSDVRMEKRRERERERERREREREREEKER